LDGPGGAPGRAAEPDGGAAVRLPASDAGDGRGLRGRRRHQPGAEAARIGLVNHVVPAADLEWATRALAEKIAAGPPRVLRLAKHMVNRAAISDLAGALDLERYSQGLASRSTSTRKASPPSSASGPEIHGPL